MEGESGAGGEADNENLAAGKAWGHKEGREY